MPITPIYGSTFPTEDPVTLGTTIAQLVSAGLLEAMVTLADSVDGQVNIWVLGYDTDCGWQPLALLECNKRDSPKLAGRNGFRDIEIPTDRYVCLYAPEIQAADVVLACIAGYQPVGSASSGGGAGISGLYIPDVPPASPSADDDEFNGGTLDPRWNLHTTGVSANPVTWLADTIDEGTVETGHVTRYQMGATGNPSALVVQPGGDITDNAGISRILTTGVTPTNWIMRAGFSLGSNRENPVSPDMNILLFMANNDPGNGFGNWDYENFIAISIQADYTGAVITAGKMVAGVFSQFSTGFLLTSTTGAQPVQYMIKKTGDFYRASVRLSNGQKLVLMSEDLSGMGLTPVRFGMAFTAAATPNPIIPVSYIRHEFAPRGF